MTIRNTWQGIQDELRRRIIDGVWLPGELIPPEAQLAQEFNCARATMNRALRGLADAGVLDRRRRAGSRVAAEPSRYARLKIDIIRLNVEQQGAVYRHAITDYLRVVPPGSVRQRMQLPDHHEMLLIDSLHFADDRPIICEQRWLNPTVIPRLFEIDFKQISPNEWLVRNLMYTRGDIAFSAACLTQAEATRLAAEVGEAAFVIERSTWQDRHCITSVRLLHQPGFSLHASLS